MANFFEEYFINPILYPNQYPPYNIYNTLVYAVLAIIVLYGVYLILKKKGIVFDEGFFKSVLPFVFFGSVLRVAEDGGVLPRVVEVGGFQFYPFVTPGIYVLTFLLLVWTWVLAKYSSQDHEEFCRKTLYAGLGLSALALLISSNVLLRAQNTAAFVLIFAMAIAVWFGFKVLWNARGLKTGFQEQAMVFGQVLDGSATFVGVQFMGYSEQHILGNAIFDLFGGPWAFLVVKILFALLVVELVRRENVEGQEKTYIMLLIAILGFGPGMRDSLRMLAGV